MKIVRTPSRRSFLAQVAGGGLAVGAGLILGAQAASATQPTRRMAVDSDPRDPARMPSPPRPSPPPSRDSDSGSNADAAGHGRTSPSAPTTTQRFVICPGNSRCPGNR